MEELSRRLALELRRRGSDTFVVTNRYPATLPRTERVDDIPVYRERFRFPEPRPRHLAGWLVGTASARQGVSRTLATHNPQVLHVQCVSSNAYYALAAARRQKLPLVVTLQGELSMDAGQAFHRSSTMRRVWRKIVAAADVVTGCSAQVVDEAVEAFGPGLVDKARVVPNGIDLAAVRAAPRERRPRPYVFAIGRLVPQKGFDVLIEAFAQIATEHPELDLVLAGDGPERSALESLARATAFSDRIEFIGGVPSARAFGLYRGSSAFVLPSRHEPQGIVVIEAMAAGAPVLATRVGGVPETVRDGENGILVPREEPAAMAAGLEALLSDTESTQRRREVAAVDVERYSWTGIADEYEACYEDAQRAFQSPGRRRAA